MIWDDVITEEDKKIFAKGGYGKHYQLGTNPALVLIDFTYEFTGWKPLPVLESQDEFPTACGENAWKAVEHAKTLLEAVRGKGLPVIFTRADRDYAVNPFNDKKNLEKEQKSWRNSDKATQVIDELCPREGEVVVSKVAPSAFWGTPLISYMVRSRVDTLIVTGGTTSGCVRATVNDAFSMGFKICLVEDAVFDRGTVSHKVNLWDMNAKQANVVSSVEALQYVENIR